MRDPKLAHILVCTKVFLLKRIAAAELLKELQNTKVSKYRKPSPYA